MKSSVQTLMALFAMTVVLTAAQSADSGFSITLTGTFVISPDWEIIVQPPDIAPSRMLPYSSQITPEKMTSKTDSMMVVLPVPVDGDGKIVLVTKG